MLRSTTLQGELRAMCGSPFLVSELMQALSLSAVQGRGVLR